MDIAVELSLYPLEQDRVPKIKDFIDRLNRGRRGARDHQQPEHPGGRSVRPGVRGAGARDQDDLWQVDKSVVVMKVIGPLTDAGLIK